MAASIENISLLATSSTGLQDLQQALITQSFSLVSYTDGTSTLELSNGRSGEIAGSLYRVTGGDFVVDMTGVSADGLYYIYFEDTGAGITCFADATVPTWRGDLGGFYLSGSTTEKAFFSVY